MKTILVTGKIGSGKSEACRYLEKKGWDVYDCDSRCKLLYRQIPGLKDRIEKELGIAFQELGMIFSDDVLRRKLEDLVFPILLKDIEQWKSSLGDVDMAFIESATAPDKPEFNFVYDEVLLIQAPLELRTSRNPEAAKRDKLQNYGTGIASYTIENTGSIEELHKKIDDLYENKSS